jgi:RecJ-like exonuclease
MTSCTICNGTKKQRLQVGCARCSGLGQEAAAAGVPCSACKGSAKIEILLPCPECEGPRLAHAGLAADDLGPELDEIVENTFSGQRKR